MCSEEKCTNTKERTKYTTEMVENDFKSRGYTLIDENFTYKNGRERIKFICPNGHNHAIAYSVFVRGGSCYLCTGSVKPTYQEVKDTIESEDGYKLLSTTYKNASTLLDIQCDKGHIYKQQYSKFKIGRRCHTCGIIKNTKYDTNIVRELMKKDGYILADGEEYVTNNTKMLTTCPNNHEYSTTLRVFNSGSRCHQCYYDKMDGYSAISKMQKCEEHANQPHHLYRFDFEYGGEVYTKVGVAKRWKNRLTMYKKQKITPFNVRLVKTTKLKAYLTEQRFLKFYRKYQVWNVNNPPPLEIGGKFNGYTECFHKH